MKFLSSFNLSDLSADSITVLEACVNAAAGNGFDFGCGDEICPALPEWSAKKVGGHMADLLDKGYISGEHIRVNGTGPRFLQFDLREDIKDAAMRYDWRLDQYADEIAADPTNCPCLEETSEGETCGDCDRTKLQGVMVTLDAPVRKVHVWLRNKALLAQARLDKFAKDFAANPTRAMEWSDRASDDAALVGVALEILVAITNRGAEVKLDELVEWVTRQLVRLASSPCRSTSNASRLSHEGQLMAYGEILEKTRFVG